MPRHMLHSGLQLECAGSLLRWGARLQASVGTPPASGFPSPRRPVTLQAQHAPLHVLSRAIASLYSAALHLVTCLWAAPLSCWLTAAKALTRPGSKPQNSAPSIPLKCCRLVSPRCCEASWVALMPAPNAVQGNLLCPSSAMCLLISLTLQPTKNSNASLAELPANPHTTQAVPHPLPPPPTPALPPTRLLPGKTALLLLECSAVAAPTKAPFKALRSWM